MGDTLSPGSSLSPSSQLISGDRRFKLDYQDDGNFVLYRNVDGTPLWSSGTVGKPTGVCIMQTDGNLVIYLPTGEPIWSTGTVGHPGSSLVVQDDGNVVIYDPGSAPLWATDTLQPPPPPTGTMLAQGDRMGPGEVLNSIWFSTGINSLNAPYTFTYQGDGNLVLYKNVETSQGRGVAALWSSGTVGRGRGVCIMQTDGNLVIYLPTGEPIWSTGTVGHPGSSLVVQDDGNVVIYDPGSAPLWATDTVEKEVSDDMIRWRLPVNWPQWDGTEWPM